MRKKISRREAIRQTLRAAAITAAGSVLPAMHVSSTSGFSYNRQSYSRLRVAVIGAGAFGGWTALHLLREGYAVTLADQYGAGNNQSASGGETRLIRPFYGNQQLYFDMALRSLSHWKKLEAQTRKQIYYPQGLLLLQHEGAVIPGDMAAAAMYRHAGIQLEQLSPSAAALRWPLIDTTGLAKVWYDPASGFLSAREGCKTVLEQFIKEGGHFVQAQASLPGHIDGRLQALSLSNGQRLEADVFVFAGGPWLLRLFPNLAPLKVTRQGYFYFAPPASLHTAFAQLPTWVNWPADGQLSYGVPAFDGRGFKIAITIQEDISDRFDTYARYLRPEELQQAQEVIQRRFPVMAGRPLIEQRICQYTETPDKDFILDRHPQADNVWIAGGGSGHGYKHGAAMGELAAANISGRLPVEPRFRINRWQP
ncbi:NAD(P)/FAD-dependent oxidoreductase [Chitinophaga solisilvae]|uniref:NAD(P)/FAD-dependent oxidoreductase n=1 Tax=Chitinophaga solisilvae TaxID=1233460 RepID=UPI00136F3090|nr:FAD-dependent oxidoreductase [Chitinophaga solisilvae]